MTTFPHARLSASGTLGLGGGDEIWSCGMKVGFFDPGAPQNLVSPTQTQIDELVTVAAPAWANFIITTNGDSSAGGLFSEWCALTQVKAAAVAANGKDDPGVNVSTQDFTSGARGTSPSSTGGRTPYQVAVVATLRGATYVRGSGALGRFYLPVPNLISSNGAGAQTMTDGLMAPATVTYIANSVATLILAINAGTYPGSIVGKVCNIGSSQDVAGTRYQAVNRVSVDNRPDTVRRRSNKLSGRGQITVTVACWGVTDLRSG